MRTLSHLSALLLFVLLALVGSTRAQPLPTLCVAPAGTSAQCAAADTFTSIGAAVGRQSSNVRILVSAGVYREEVRITGAQNLTIEGETGAVVSAFNTTLNWTQESNGLFSAAVPVLGNAANAWPNDVTPTPAALIRSPVYVGDVRLQPVNGRVTHAAPLTIEYGAREYAILVTNSQNVVIRGLAVEGCASHLRPVGCLDVEGSSDVLLENITATRGSYSGVQVNGSQRVTVRNLAAHDNGVRGFGATSSSGVVLDTAALHRNGWRVQLFDGSSKPLIFWDGGNKWFTCEDCEVHHADIDSTYGAGVWLDWRNTAFLVEDVTVRNSSGAGIFVEAHCDVPSVTLRDVRIEHTVTRGNDATYLNADLFITGTNGGRYENVTIVSNTLNAVLVNNYNRFVGSCNPVAGTENKFTGLQITRETSGQFVHMVNTSSGYPRSTTVQVSTSGAGVFRINGQNLSAEQFVSQLAAGSRVDGVIVQPTATLAPTAPPVPTASPTPPDVLLTPAPLAPDADQRISVEIGVQIEVADCPIKVGDVCYEFDVTLVTSMP